MEARVTAVEKAIIRIDATLPTLATRSDVSEMRADFHKEMTAQTWRLVTSVLGAAAITITAVIFAINRAAPSAPAASQPIVIQLPAQPPAPTPPPKQ